MSLETPFILAVGAKAGLLSKLDPVLGRSNLTVQRVQLGEAALKVAKSKRPNLLVIAYPLLDMRLDAFLGHLATGRHNPQVPTIAIIADEHLVPELEPHLNEHHHCLPAHLEPEELQSSLLRLIGSTTRIAPRLMLRLEVQLGAGKMLRMCQTDNISASGMLVRLQDPIPVGSEVRLAINLPSVADPIHARAEVARQTDPDRESVRGLGLRFVEFEGDGRNTLTEYLSLHGAATSE